MARGEPRGASSHAFLFRCFFFGTDCESFMNDASASSHPVYKGLIKVRPLNPKAAPPRAAALKP